MKLVGAVQTHCYFGSYSVLPKPSIHRHIWVWPPGLPNPGTNDLCTLQKGRPVYHLPCKLTFLSSEVSLGEHLSGSQIPGKALVSTNQLRPDVILRWVPFLFLFLRAPWSSEHWPVWGPWCHQTKPHPSGLWQFASVHPSLRKTRLTKWIHHINKITGKKRTTKKKIKQQSWNKKKMVDSSHQSWFYN